MVQRMIFFPHKRRVNAKLLAVTVALTMLTAASFAAGLQVGVHYATVPSPASHLQSKTTAIDF